MFLHHLICSLIFAGFFSSPSPVQYRVHVCRCEHVSVCVCFQNHSKPTSVPPLWDPSIFNAIFCFFFCEYFLPAFWSEKGLMLRPTSKSPATRVTKGDGRGLPLFVSPVCLRPHHHHHHRRRMSLHGTSFRLFRPFRSIPTARTRGLNNFPPHILRRLVLVCMQMFFGICC